jgi:hypothetical protein
MGDDSPVQRLQPDSTNARRADRPRRCLAGGYERGTFLGWDTPNGLTAKRRRHGTAGGCSRG